MLKEEFQKAYETVFGSDGNIKACGRAATKALIGIADQIEPGTAHGSPDTGVMDVAAIKALKQSL